MTVEESKGKVADAPKLGTSAFEFVEEFYNKPELYERLSAGEDSENLILRNLLRDIDFEGKVVLDLGAGTGKLSIPLAMESRLMYALDISPGLLAVLKKKARSHRIKNIKILESDYSRIPLPDGSVDVVVSSWSFPSHSPDKERDFAEVKRVLGEGGRMAIVDNSLKGEFQSILTDVFHESLEFIRAQDRWLRAHGFAKPKTLDILVDFGSREGVLALGRFWGPHVAGYIIGKNKTSFKLGVSISYFEK